MKTIEINGNTLIIDQIELTKQLQTLMNVINFLKENPLDEFPEEHLNNLDSLENLISELNYSLRIKPKRIINNETLFGKKEDKKEETT